MAAWRWSPTTNARPPGGSPSSAPRRRRTAHRPPTPQTSARRRPRHHREIRRRKGPNRTRARVVRVVCLTAGAPARLAARGGHPRPSRRRRLGIDAARTKTSESYSNGGDEIAATYPGAKTILAAGGGCVLGARRSPRREGREGERRARRAGAEATGRRARAPAPRPRLRRGPAPDSAWRTDGPPPRDARWRAWISASPRSPRTPPPNAPTVWRTERRNLRLSPRRRRARRVSGASPRRCTTRQTNSSF